MLYRPVAGLVAGLLMSQLVLARSDLLCLQHEGESSTAKAAVTDVADASHHHDGETQGQQSVPSEHQSLPTCCPAMTACSTGFAIQSEIGSLTLALRRDGVVAVVGALPPSRVESPDPPPPKS
jgi:hypothetical protein